MNEVKNHVEVVEMAYAPNSVKDAQKGPGELLRNARFALDLSLNHIAEQLHLSRHVISALEADEYEKLPGVTFVRGYLRSYARVVNLPGDDIIEKFNELGFEDTTKLETQPAAVKYDFIKNENMFRWMSYGIVCVFFILAYVWWRNHNGSWDISPANTMIEAALETEEAKEHAEEPVTQVAGDTVSEVSHSMSQKQIKKKA